jgi:hypothetical protein
MDRQKWRNRSVHYGFGEGRLTTQFSPVATRIANGRELSPNFGDGLKDQVAPMPNVR